jgi:hypothetical protein
MSWNFVAIREMATKKLYDCDLGGRPEPVSAQERNELSTRYGNSKQDEDRLLIKQSSILTGTYGHVRAIIALASLFFVLIFAPSSPARADPPITVGQCIEHGGSTGDPDGSPIKSCCLDNDVTGIKGCYICDGHWANCVWDAGRGSSFTSGAPPRQPVTGPVLREPTENASPNAADPQLKLSPETVPGGPATTR